jgi:uncharacterized membrane protein
MTCFRSLLPLFALPAFQLAGLASAQLTPPDKFLPEPAYDVQVLPSPPGAVFAFGHGLNNLGQAAGIHFETLWFEGVIWPDASSFVDLTCLTGWEYTEATGINDAGFFTGTGAPNATVMKPQAFIGHRSTGVQFLAPVVSEPLIQSAGIDIARNGLIAGYSDTVASSPTAPLNPQRRAVLWNDTGAHVLGTLGGDLSTATAVNSTGMVVGLSNAQLGGLVYAFAWSPSSGMQRLAGLSPGGRTIAADVNEKGIVVGDADSFTGRFAVYWTDVDTIHTLPNYPGDGYSEATGINLFGQIIGRGVAGDIEARLWQNGRVYDLDELAGPDLDVFGAEAINDRGQILASAFDLTLPELQAVAILMTPR